MSNIRDADGKDGKDGNVRILEDKIHRTEVDTLKARIAELEEKLQVAGQGLAEWDERNASLHERDHELCARIKELEAENKSIKKLNSDLTDHLEGSGVVKELLEDELEVQEKTASSLREMMEERESEIEALSSILEERDEAISILRDEESGRIEAVAQSPTIIHKWESGESPVSVKLTKNTKGYGWEISVKARDQETLMEELRKVENDVKGEYGTFGE